MEGGSSNIEEKTKPAGEETGSSGALSTSASITESTVVLTTSQIMDESASASGGVNSDLTKSYAIHESMIGSNDSDKEKEEEKMIVKEAGSETNNDTSATNDEDDEDDEDEGEDEDEDEDEEQSNDEGASFPPNTFSIGGEEKPEDEQEDEMAGRKREPASPPSSPVHDEHSLLERHALATSVINAAADDLENIVKDYEIPDSIEPASDVNAPTTASAVDVPVLEDAKKPAKNLADEKFERILGNDSLMKKTTAYGDESGERPLTGQMCTIAYKAFVKDTDKIVEQDDDLNFILGDGDVVAGLDMSVSLMYRGEKCEIICDSRHAYGQYGKLPTIPANTSLKYEVHLKDYKDLPEFEKMDAVQRLSLAEAKKLRGNFNFNRQDFEMAILSYKRGLKYFNEENLDPTEDSKNLEKFLELRLTLLMNTALSYYKLNDFKAASETLDELLKAQSKHKKALYIKGKVLMQLGEMSDAIKFFNRALELDPANGEVKNELTKAQAKYRVQRENEKKLYQKMLKGVSETTDEDKRKRSSKTNAAASSNYLGYIAAGVVIAMASIGVAMFIKSRNLI